MLKAKQFVLHWASIRCDPDANLTSMTSMSGAARYLAINFAFNFSILCFSPGAPGMQCTWHLALGILINRPNTNLYVY